MRHIISILVENKFGVLARIAGMFSGRGFNIETLNVGPMVNPKLSRITATIIGDSSSIDQAIKQVTKLINVLEVTEYSKGQATDRELLMLRIKANAEQRSQVEAITKNFRTDITDVEAEIINLEMTGNSADIQSFLSELESFEIIEMARTGNVALKRGS